MNLKKLGSIIYDYICYITQRDFLTLLGTFCRFIVYGAIIVNIKQSNYIYALIISIIQCISVGFNISGFKMRRAENNGLTDKTTVKIAKRSIKKTLIEFYEVENKESSFREKLSRERAMNEALHYLCDESDKKLKELENRDKNEE